MCTVNIKNNMNIKFLASSLLAFSIHSSADSLLDIYNDALENDPQYKSAEFSYLSGKEIKVQGRAALLPSISISAQTNWNEYYQNGNLQINTITLVPQLDLLSH